MFLPRSYSWWNVGKFCFITDFWYTCVTFHTTFPLFLSLDAHSCAFCSVSLQLFVLYGDREIIFIIPRVLTTWHCSRPYHFLYKFPLNNQYKLRSCKLPQASFWFIHLGCSYWICLPSLSIYMHSSSLESNEDAGVHLLTNLSGEIWPCIL